MEKGIPVQANARTTKLMWENAKTTPAVSRTLFLTTVVHILVSASMMWILLLFNVWTWQSLGGPASVMAEDTTRLAGASLKLKYASMSAGVKPSAVLTFLTFSMGIVTTTIYPRNALTLKGACGIY
jgi:hypothetical protein